MSERVDKKLQDVVVGRFEYRYEAEFAAGFLDDAGIPYRLQVDDAVLGMTIASPATLWVRGIDEAWARELLEPGTDPTGHGSELGTEVEIDEVPGGTALAGTLDDAEPTVTPPSSVPAPNPPASYSAAEQLQPTRRSLPGSPPRSREAVGTAPLQAAGARVESVEERRRGRIEAGRLSPLERAIAVLLCGAVGWLGVGLLGAPAGGLWALVAGAVGVPLGVGALVGRTVPPFDRLLRALSGSAP